MKPSKRILDLTLGLLLLPALCVPLGFIYLAIKCSSKGPAIHWSKRIGKDGVIFYMAKFRTMYVDTPVVASHLLLNADLHLTVIGSFLRKLSLDELPQLWNILIGDMSFVGPRPALFNQDDLIALRKLCEVDKLVPGLTGWAQVNGRDELSIPLKVQYEVEYLNKQSISFDIKILGLTFLKVVRRSGVSH
jgi:O-antigen biosynthesis protein WbqP